MKFNRRASTFMLLFFVALVILIFYLVYLQNRKAVVEFTTSQEQKSQLNSYSEILRTYSFHSFRDALIRASYDSASSGAGAQNSYWISYSSSIPPKLWEAKSNLSRFAIIYTNQYLASIRGEDLGKFKIEDAGDISSIEILVSDTDLYEMDGSAGADEGFLAEGRGTIPAVVKEVDSGEEVQEQNAFKSYAYPLRYWYLYRKIEEWARQNIVSQYSCDKLMTYYGVGTSACPAYVINEEYVKQIADSSLKHLQDSFDSYVKCTYTLPCLYAKTEILCSAAINCPAGCGVIWPASGCPYPDLKQNCLSGQKSDGKCENPQNIPSPPEQPQVEIPFGTQLEPNTLITCPFSPYGYGERHNIDFIMNITCIDTKYQHPISESGFENLRFNLLVHVFLTRTTNPPEPECDCPEHCEPTGDTPSSCFPAGTRIRMADGSLKNIEDVRVGELVLGYDFKTGKHVPARVLELESPYRDHLCTVSFEDGSFLRLTDEHPIYTLKGWASISPENSKGETPNLKVLPLERGDYAFSFDGKNIILKRVISLECSPTKIRTYNLKRIESVNDFYAEGILVHNKDEPNPTPEPPSRPYNPPNPSPPPPDQPSVS
ncbi:MAG: hypothetical protein QXT20_03400 [Candidatus Woesearchaeota archaeon]